MKAPNDYTDLLASDPTRHTAPAAPHGLRDLGLGLLVALLLCGVLNLSSCVRRPAGKSAVSVPLHDSRTKRAEPYPSRIK